MWLDTQNTYIHIRTVNIMLGTIGLVDPLLCIDVYRLNSVEEPMSLSSFLEEQGIVCWWWVS